MKELDIETLTLGEISEIEEIAGVGLNALTAALEGGDQPVGKLLQAIALIRLRRENPDATLEDAKALKMTDLVPEDAPNPLGEQSAKTG